MNILERAKEAWTVFRGRDRPVRDWSSYDNWGSGKQVTQFAPGYGDGGGWNGFGSGPSSADRPDRIIPDPQNAKTVLTSIMNRIAVDVAMVEFHHAIIDDNDNFKEVKKGSIEDALRVSANIDQTAFNYAVDLVYSELEEGVVAEVPINCDRDEKTYEITDEEPLILRTGKIVSWKPKEVKVKIYDERFGRKDDFWLPKEEVCIHENPFYMVMNHSNGLLSRLTRKMALMDSIDERMGSDKLNAIVQLPYQVRGDVKRAEARNRIQEMEDQMKKSELGISYIDNAEKVIQLNRPLGEGLQSQIEWMTELYMSQLCITKDILNGTADAKVMANYMQRCVGVICTAIAQERTRKFLSLNQRKNMESIVFVQDPFRLIPVTELADLMDKSIRGAILSPNEWRGIIGYKPSDDPSSDLLANRNMPMDQTPEASTEDSGGEAPEGSGRILNEGELAKYAEHSAIPLNRQQRRHMDRSKVPRERSG